jgi:hypothetical protein
MNAQALDNEECYSMGDLKFGKSGAAGANDGIKEPSTNERPGSRSIFAVDSAYFIWIGRRPSFGHGSVEGNGDAASGAWRQSALRFRMDLVYSKIAIQVAPRRRKGIIPPE